MEKEKIFENFTEHCFSRRLIDRLTEENKRLKEQLDREVKINRKMKRALEKYANEYCWYRYGDDGLKIVYIYASHNGYDTAQQVLKEIDNKE